MKTKSILLHVSRLLLLGHLIMLIQVTNSHASTDNLNLMHIESKPLSLKIESIRTSDVMLDASGLLNTAELNYGSSQLQMDPCGCDIALLQSLAWTEVSYIAAIALCPITGPGVLICWGVASALKAGSIALAVYQHDGCIDTCDQLQEN